GSLVLIGVLLAGCPRPGAAPPPRGATSGPPSRRHVDPSFFAKMAPSSTIGSTAVEAAPQMRVHLIDVGQGAATLFEFSCAAVLVDTGGESDDDFDSNEHLMDYLRAFFTSRPDLHETLALLLITHPHIDHARGAKGVWQVYHVQNVVTDGMTSSSGGRQQGALIKAAEE